MKHAGVYYDVETSKWDRQKKKITSLTHLVYDRLHV